MRAQNLRSYGCQAFAGLVVAVLLGFCLLALSACTGSTGGAPQFRILTPYGDFDGNTSQTITIDTRPYFPQYEPLPPPIDYSLYGTQTLEK